MSVTVEVVHRMDVCLLICDMCRGNGDCSALFLHLFSHLADAFIQTCLMQVIEEQVGVREHLAPWDDPQGGVQTQN